MAMFDENTFPDCPYHGRDTRVAALNDGGFGQSALMLSARVSRQSVLGNGE